MSVRRKFTEEEIENFAKAVEESETIMDCLPKIGLKQFGGNYKVFYTYAKRMGVDVSKFENEQRNILKPT